MTPSIPPRIEIVSSGLVMPPAVCMHLAVLTGGLQQWYLNNDAGELIDVVARVLVYRTRQAADE